MLVGRPYESRDPNIARLKLATVAVVFAAWVVVSVGLMQTPNYEASAWVMVAFGEHNGQPRPIPKHFVTPGQLDQTMATTHSSPVAEEVISRLGLEISPSDLLSNLRVEQGEASQFIRVSYTDTDPVKAAQIVGTVGEVSSEVVSERSRTLTVTVFEKARVPSSPVSPNPLRNGLITLVVGLALVGALKLARVI